MMNKVMLAIITLVVLGCEVKKDKDLQDKCRIICGSYYVEACNEDRVICDTSYQIHKFNEEWKQHIYIR